MGLCWGKGSMSAAEAAQKEQVNPLAEEADDAPHPKSVLPLLGMLIAAQARACVDCPTLQVVGPQSCNQALKAMAIARTFLKESQDIDICMEARAANAARNSPPRNFAILTRTIRRTFSDDRSSRAAARVHLARGRPHRHAPLDAEESAAHDGRGRGATAEECFSDGREGAGGRDLELRARGAADERDGDRRRLDQPGGEGHRDRA